MPPDLKDVLVSMDYTCLDFVICVGCVFGLSSDVFAAVAHE